MSSVLLLDWKPVLAWKPVDPNDGADGPTWEVSTAKDISSTTDAPKKFVKLMQAGVLHGFPRLVFHEALKQGALTNEHKATWSLSQSTGYLELQRMRNAALTEKLMQKIPSWQRASAEKVLMKAKVQAAKEPSTSLTITIPAVSNYEEQDILVVRPKYDHEELRVELDEKKIAHIIMFFVEHGFSRMPRKRERDPTLPQGVHRRLRKINGGTVEKYIVPDESGNHKTKVIRDLHDYASSTQASAGFGIEGEDQQEVEEDEEDDEQDDEEEDKQEDVDSDANEDQALEFEAVDKPPKAVSADGESDRNKESDSESPCKKQGLHRFFASSSSSKGSTASKSESSSS